MRFLILSIFVTGTWRNLYMYIQVFSIFFFQHLSLSKIGLLLRLHLGPFILSQGKVLKHDKSDFIYLFTGPSGMLKTWDGKSSHSLNISWVKDLLTKMMTPSCSSLMMLATLLAPSQWSAPIIQTQLSWRWTLLTWWEIYIGHSLIRNAYNLAFLNTAWLLVWWGGLCDHYVLCGPWHHQ